ncbi:glutamate receptor U1-like [Centruroides vittatus]|uniref:glutamate receptor U1-like n=1 Tax=Centruroides vittatus TaxID=120091 RepID=UPI00350F6E31
MFKEVCELLQIKRLLTTAYHPACNGIVERFNKTLIDIIAHYIAKDQRDWDKWILYALFAYNTTIHASTGDSPFFLLYGRDPTFPFDLITSPTRTKYDVEDNYASELQISNDRSSSVHPIESVLGDKHESGKWDGVLGQVANQEADVAFLPVGVNHERFSAMEFTSVFSFYPVSFVIKAPDNVDNWNFLTKPFTLKVWIAIFSIVLIFGLTLHKVLEKDFITAKTGKRWTLCVVFWNLICTFLGEGLNLEKVKRFASRFMIGIWWLSIVVLVSSYSGTLMSFMTCPLTESFPRDFQELSVFVRNGEYSCGTYKGFLPWKDIMESKSENSKILRENILSNNNSMAIPQGIKKVQNERFAYIMTKILLNLHINKAERPKYVMSKDSFRTYIIAYPIRKNFPFKKDLTDTVTRMFEAGIFEKLFPQEFEDFQKASEFKPLTIKDVKSTLLLMGIGYLVSLICLTIEIILTKLSQVNGFSPKCILTCLRRLKMWLNLLPQKLQRNGFSPEWIRS